MAQKSSKPFTDKQVLFIQEYLKDLNGKAAYIRAGYKARGKSAEVNASRLLSNAKVRAAIQVAMAERIERTQVDQDRVIAELAKIAFSSLTQFCEWGPGGVDLFESIEIDPDAAACIQEVSDTLSKQGRVVRFKLHDKCPALNMLGKHLGLFSEKVEHSGQLYLFVDPGEIKDEDEWAETHAGGAQDSSSGEK